MAKYLHKIAEKVSKKTVIYFTAATDVMVQAVQKGVDVVFHVTESEIIVGFFNLYKSVR